MTFSGRKVDMAPGIHTAKAEAIFSRLSTPRLTAGLLTPFGAPVEETFGRSPTVSPCGVHCWQHHRVGPRGSPRALPKAAETFLF